MHLPVARLCGFPLLPLLRQLLCILHFQFQLPGGELAEEGVEIGAAKPLVLNTELPRSMKARDSVVADPLCRSEFALQFMKLDCLPRCHFHVPLLACPCIGDDRL